MRYKIRVKRKYFDILEKRSVEIGEELEVTETRKDKLVGMGLVEVIKEVEAKKLLKRKSKKSTKKK